MYKKIISGLLALAMVFGTGAPLVESGATLGAEISVSAETSGDYEYKVLPNGAVEITGWNGTDKVLKIPSKIDGKKVTAIGDDAFGYHANITSATIPNSVTSIGSSAFEGCFNLKSVTIPDSVTSIGGWAFAHCASLASVKLPDGVTSIGECAFWDCTNLTSVTIPDGVTSIGDTAFWNCTSLTSVTIPESVTSIGDLVFNNCSNLTDITVSDGNKNYSCEDGILYDKNKETLILCPKGKKEVTIPDGITSIGNYAFVFCNNLTNVTIPDGVTSIGYGAFENCESLTSVTIPEGVTSIGDYAFDGCDNLTIYCYDETAAEKYAIEHGIDYVLLDDKKDFIYDDSNVFVADGMLGRAVMPGGNILPSAGDMLAVLPSSREFIYELQGKEIANNTLQYGSALFWQNLEKALDGDFVGMANWQEIMYESLIIDYLAYNGESEDFNSDLSESTLSFEKDILDEAADKGIKSLKNLSTEDAKKYAKTIKTVEKFDDIDEIFDDASKFAKTGFDYFKNLSKALAVKQANENRIAFLKEMKKESGGDEYFNNAVDKVIGYYESAAADSTFNYCDEYATQFLVKTAWSEFVSDAAKACPAVEEASKLLELGSSGFDWLFNNDDVSSSMLETVAVYTMGRYAEDAYISLREDYDSSGAFYIPGDSDKASKFIYAFENYVAYKNYANNIVDKYLYQLNCEALLIRNIQTSITYIDWKNAIKSEKDSSNSWISRINSFRNFYYQYSGYKDPFANDTAHAHTWNSGKVTKAATCTATGTKTYTCTVCGQTKTETIKKAAHKYTTKVVNPTFTVKGYTLHKCSVCGTSYKDKYTAKLSRDVSKAKITVSKTKAYTGKAIKPSVTVKIGTVKLKKNTDYTVSYKNNNKTGKATITIKGKGKFKGKKTASFIIVPKKPGTPTAKALGGKKIKVTVKKDKMATGYQIQVSTSKRFTKVTTKTSTLTKTAKTFTKLKKGMKYYVRSRSYVKVGKTKYYGAYSKLKSVKCK